MCSLINSLFFAFNPLTCFAKLSFCAAIKKLFNFFNKMLTSAYSAVKCSRIFSGRDCLCAVVNRNIGCESTRSRFCWKLVLNSGSKACRSALDSRTKIQINLIGRLHTTATIACSFDKRGFPDSKNCSSLGVPHHRSRIIAIHPWTCHRPSPSFRDVFRNSRSDDSAPQGVPLTN